MGVDPSSRFPPRVSRRRFLLGALAAGTLGPAVATACSSSGDGSGAAAGPQLVHLFSPDHVIAAGMPQRVPFGVVADPAARLDLADDAELAVRVLAGDDVVDETTVVGRVVDHDHVGPAADDPDHQHADLFRYFALRTVLPEPGIYDVEVRFDASTTARLPVQAFEPATVAVPLAGDALPVVSTPTTSDPAGIDPICTRSPDPCPFHELDVAEVLAAGRPLALLVATPALCATAYCGPVVDTLIEAIAAGGTAYGDLAAVHLEVYANASEVDGNYGDPALRIATPVAELGLEFEPSLFLVDRAGVVVDRIDNIFDRTELDGALAGITAG